MRESKILKSNLIEIRRRKRFDFSIMCLASSSRKLEFESGENYEIVQCNVS